MKYTEGRIVKMSSDEMIIAYLEMIIEENTDSITGTIDYDGIAEYVIRTVEEKRDIIN
jgi:hypothetical protein